LEALYHYSSHDREGDGELQISPDGQTLVIYNHGTSYGFFSHRALELLTITLDAAYRPIHNQQGYTSEQHYPYPYGNKGKGRVEFGKDSGTIYFGQKSLVKTFGGDSTHLRTYRQSQHELVAMYSYEMGVGYFGDLRRFRGHSLFQPHAGDSVRTKIEDGLPYETAQHRLMDTVRWIGSLSYQPHRVYREDPIALMTSRSIGNKVYELTDHLGNVRVVVSDGKEVETSGGLLVGLLAEVESYSNYYSFGMQMPGRTYSGNKYRYGFNGKEREDGIAGGGYDYGERIYDSRIGRWLTLDKKSKDYPDQSPYHFTGNSPIMLIEYMGNDYGIAIDHTTQMITIQANIYVSDYERTGASADPNYAFNSAQAAATYLNSQTAVFQVVDANGVSFNYTVQMQINVIPESQVPAVGRGIDPVKAAANNDPIGNSFKKQLKEIPSDQQGKKRADGVTYGNKTIISYDYFSSDGKKGLMWYPDHVQGQNTRAGFKNEPAMADIHEIGHLLLGNNTSFYFHNQNNTFMTSQENNILLTPALINPQNFFGTILGQAGLGTTPAATGTPAANPYKGYTSVTGTAPTNFEKGQILNNQ
jgi:RHS repeat-associated protein